MARQKKLKREQYVIMIGPLLKKVLDEQIERIKEVTYFSSEPSYYQAGEVIAKKFRGEV
jgi:hypothetical protein